MKRPFADPNTYHYLHFIEENVIKSSEIIIHKIFEQLPLEEQAKFIQFSQEMESLGILVAEQVIDIDLVDKTLGSFVSKSWQSYKVIFEELRVKHSDPFFRRVFSMVSGICK
jgi:hypothetical protein